MFCTDLFKRYRWEVGAGVETITKAHLAQQNAVSGDNAFMSAPSRRGSSKISLSNGPSYEGSIDTIIKTVI